MDHFTRVSKSGLWLRGIRRRTLGSGPKRHAMKYLLLGYTPAAEWDAETADAPRSAGRVLRLPGG